MNQDTIRQIAAQTFRVVLLASGPALLVSLVTGLLIGLFQTVTQIQEFTLTFVPKIIAVFVCIFVLAPWLTKVLVGFTYQMIYNIPSYIR
ncbi:MAG: flagellar biosynthesis protein FliQ [Nitrospiraceae bacterium]|nr:flagellar biosynthesis protein FliQ [Nitrospiraceae bacterium]MDA8325811.1 flagellar biosynthesis protein FliQ [Nitrospiraceae bacterium]